MEQNQLLKAPEKTVFLQYLIPGILSMLAVSCYSFVDTFVVGQAIGADAVAAMGVGTPVVSFLYAIGFLLGTGGAVRFTLKKTDPDPQAPSAAFTFAFFAAAVFGALICIAGNLWTHQLARALGATSGNVGLAVSYLRWVVSLGGFMILDLVMNNFMRNEGHPNVSMAATLTGTGLNIVLDFWFVMGLGWGMDGAAGATCLASIISVLINCGYAFCRETALRFHFSKRIFREIIPVFQIGLGAFVLEGAVAVISVVFLNAAGKAYGDAGVSAYSVLMTLNLVCYSLLNGVAQSVQPLVSANYAANLPDRVARFLRCGMLASVVLGAIFFAAGEVFSTGLCAMLVGRDEAALALSARGLRLHAPAFLFMSVSILSGIYYQAKGQGIPSFFILVGRSAVFPILLLLAGQGLIGETMVWIAVPAGEFFAVLLAAAFLMKSRAFHTEPFRHKEVSQV